MLYDKRNIVNYQYPHQFSSLHRNDIINSTLCGCFHCLETFPPEKIIEWVDEDENNIGQTALCPFCSIDSVIGNKSISVKKELLIGMKKYWF
jgi:hypothetical protein